MARSVSPKNRGGKNGSTRALRSPSGAAHLQHQPTSCTSTCIDMQSGMPPSLDDYKKQRWMGQSVHDVQRNYMHFESQDLSMLDEQGEFEGLTQLPQPRDPNHVRVKCTCPRSWRHIKKLIFPHGFFFFKVEGLLWFFSLLWPYMSLGVGASILAREAGRVGDIVDDKALGNLQRIHVLFGTILSMTIVFRTNAAYDRFYEGRKLVGSMSYHLKELVLEAYSQLGKQVTPTDPSKPAIPGATSPPLLRLDHKMMELVPQDMRRRVNVLMAFARQSLREAEDGFMPGSDLEGVEFSDSTFYMDPVRPRLWDLLSKHEVAKYMNVPAASRPHVLMGEIKATAQVFCAKLEQPGTFVVNCNTHLKGVHDTMQAMWRIRTTPVPYPYIYILNVTTFAFVYATPFLYATDTVANFLGVQLLIYSYYGILQIGLQLEDPFGYDPFDLPLEQYCRKLHDETLHMATALGRDTKSYIPDYLVEAAPLMRSPKNTRALSPSAFLSKMRRQTTAADVEVEV